MEPLPNAAFPSVQLVLPHLEFSFLSWRVGPAHLEPLFLHLWFKQDQNPTPPTMMWTLGFQATSQAFPE